MRKLSCSALLDVVKSCFSKIIDETTSRNGLVSISDCLMSAYAMFSLKYPSLLQFDKHFREDIIRHNLKRVYEIDNVPSDTQMRARLDQLNPRQLRKTFTRLFAQCQRSKHLELFKYYDNRYLMPLDGTGYFCSKDVHCEHCCEKNHKDGSKSYYHNMLSAVIAHPDQKVVIPFAPEMIMKCDGKTKNDSEHSAAKRFLADLKREHPHLRLIITGDGLYPDGPFIKQLTKDDHQFIIVAKEKDLKYLFTEFRALPQHTHETTVEGITHSFAWANHHILNNSHHDCKVNVLEYWEVKPDGTQQHWVWITNIELSEKCFSNYARRKNQKQDSKQDFQYVRVTNLSTVFAYLMLIAFVVDQLQQLGFLLKH